MAGGGIDYDATMPSHGGEDGRGRYAMPEQSAPHFGGLLRQLRTQAQLTQQELARAASLSTRTVSDLERVLFVAAARGRRAPISAETPARRTGMTGSVPPAGALIGRDAELATLAGLMAEVAAGQGNSVLIEGEPGIGKSALVRAALAQAAGV